MKLFILSWSNEDWKLADTLRNVAMRVQHCGHCIRLTQDWLLAYSRLTDRIIETITNAVPFPDESVLLIGLEQHLVEWTLKRLIGQCSELDIFGGKQHGGSACNHHFFTMFAQTAMSYEFELNDQQAGNIELKFNKTLVRVRLAQIVQSGHRYQKVGVSPRTTIAAIEQFHHTVLGMIRQLQVGKNVKSFLLAKELVQQVEKDSEIAIINSNFVDQISQHRFQIVRITSVQALTIAFSTSPVQTTIEKCRFRNVEWWQWVQKFQSGQLNVEKRFACDQLEGDGSNEISELTIQGWNFVLLFVQLQSIFRVQSFQKSFHDRFQQIRVLVNVGRMQSGQKAFVIQYDFVAVSESVARKSKERSN